MTALPSGEPPRDTSPDRGPTTSSVSHLILAAICGVLLVDYAADLVQWIMCGGSVVIGRYASGDECGASSIEEAAMIGVFLAGMTAIITSAFGVLRGKISSSEAFSLIAATFAGALMALLKAAAGEASYPNLAGMGTPVAIHLSCLFLFVLLARAERARDAFDLVLRIGIVSLLGFLLGIVVQGAAPAALDGLSGVDNWPEWIVAPSATVAAGAAFSTGLLGLEVSTGDLRRRRMVATILGVAVVLSAGWAMLVYFPKHGSVPSGWLLRKDVDRWQITAICCAILLPAIFAAGVARSTSQSRYPMRRFAWGSLIVIPLPAAAIWIATQMRDEPLAYSRLPALLIVQAATPLLVLIGVSIGLRLAGRLLDGRYLTRGRVDSRNP